MTYTELVDLIQEYLENEETSFVANIPMFVKLTEEDIYRAVQFAYLRKTASLTFVGGNPSLDLPTDFLSVYSLAVDNSGYSFLTSKDTNFIREAYPSASTQGVPRYFALTDEDSIIVGPAPASGYSAELQYYYKPESIVTADTNWVSENAESALLYGALYHGYVYMKGDQDVVNMYKEKYMQAIDALKVIEEGRKRKDTYRTSDSRAQT